MKDDIRFGYRIRGSYLLQLEAYAYRTHTDFIVIHCSADAEEDGINDHAEDIREMHVHKRDFMDIGYHFVIERDGVIVRGRPPMAVGAGAAGHNHDSIHICMVGGADKKGHGENDFTELQWKSLNFMVFEAAKAYPNARVQGHRDFPKVAKDCPSFDAIRWWGEQKEPELGLPVEGEADGDLFH